MSMELLILFKQMMIICQNHMPPYVYVYMWYIIKYVLYNLY